MFGNFRILTKDTFIILILLGFCIYIVKLFIDNEINLYIHNRYTLFTVAMTITAFVFVTVGAVYKLRKSHFKTNKKLNIKLLDFLVLFTLFLAVFLPARTLSSETVSRKALYTASEDNEALSHSSEINCPPDSPGSIERLLGEFSIYSIDCFEDLPMKLTGFVFEPSKEDQLPDGMFYLGRVIISCCVVDARPFAVPIEQGEFKSYPKDTWLEVNGLLKVKEVFGTRMLVLEPNELIEIEEPENPYEYIL